MNFSKNLMIKQTQLKKKILMAPRFVGPSQALKMGLFAQVNPKNPPQKQGTEGTGEHTDVTLVKADILTGSDTMT